MDKVAAHHNVCHIFSPSTLARNAEILPALFSVLPGKSWKQLGLFASTGIASVALMSCIIIGPDTDPHTLESHCLHHVRTTQYIYTPFFFSTENVHVFPTLFSSTESQIH